MLLPQVDLLAGFGAVATERDQYKSLDRQRARYHCHGFVTSPPERCLRSLVSLPDKMEIHLLTEKFEKQ